MEYSNFSPLFIQILPLYHTRQHLHLLLVGLELLGQICHFQRISPSLPHFSSFCSLVFVAHGFSQLSRFCPTLGPFPSTGISVFSCCCLRSVTCCCCSPLGASQSNNCTVCISEAVLQPCALKKNNFYKMYVWSSRKCSGGAHVSADGAGARAGATGASHTPSL